MRFFTLLLISVCFTVGCANAQEPSSSDPKKVEIKVRTDKSHDKHDDPRPFDIERNAMDDVDAAIETAKATGSKALIVMGANWCHDSRGLAGRFERPEFQTLIENSYELVYVSAGTNPGQNDQNREVSERFGVDKIEGTPTVFIVTGEGEVLNSESAGYWRNAHSIPTDMSFAYFDYYANR